MNERIKELIKQATFTVTDYSMGIDSSHEEFDKEYFANMIVRDCLMLIEKQTGGPYEVTMTPETRQTWNLWIDIKEHFSVKT